MVSIVLVEPEIPQNTGNIARTCACLGAPLHLIEPMGFRPTERNLRRAGCDYWDKVAITCWPCVQAFFDAREAGELGGGALHLFTGQASAPYHEASYSDGDFLVFGRESRGLDSALIETYADCCRRIPMVDGARSLNLSNAVAIAAYEACRQQGWPGLS